MDHLAAARRLPNGFAVLGSQTAGLRSLVGQTPWSARVPLDPLCEFRAHRQQADEISRMANAIIVDSSQLGGIKEFRRFRADTQVAERTPRIADLAWTRITPWRGMIAQLFENPAASERHSRISEAAVWAGGAMAYRRLKYTIWRPGSSKEGSDQ